MTTPEPERVTIRSGEDFILGNYTRSSQSLRAEKWARLVTARRLLTFKPMPWEEFPNIKFHRVTKCVWCKAAYMVEGWKNDADMTAHFRGVFTCGSVHVCPVCSEKIMTHYRGEVRGAVAAAHLLEWNSILISLTIAHTRDEALFEVRGDISWMTRAMYGDRRWKDIKKRFGFMGGVVIDEVTVSLKNGWHAHKHRMEFVDRALTKNELKLLEGEIYDIFKKYAVKCKRKVLPEVAVNVRAGDDFISDYITKFGYEPKGRGLSYEMTYSTMKNKRVGSGHYIAFQLLDFAAAGDKIASDLFIEFGLTMEGTTKLRFSPGLRDRLDMGPMVDDEILAAMGDDESRLFVLFCDEAWHVARLKPDQVIDAMARMTFDEFKAWAESHGIAAESPFIVLLSESDGVFFRRDDVVMGDPRVME